MSDKWKIVSPEETLKKINKIIHQLNFIENFEWNTFDIDHNVFSCDYNIVNQEHLCTQGKGTSPIYAMASAKAEFLERLQNYMLTFRPEGAICFKDEKLNKKNQILTPYYNCSTGQLEYFSWYSVTNDSTGMASGNSYEEAIVQGICEIVERYSYYLFSQDQLQIHCPLTLPKQYEQLLQLYNIKYKLYTCDLFNIPVVYLELYINNGLAFTIDCGPTYEIAIERCITELLQGYDLDLLLEKQKYHPIVENGTVFDIYKNQYEFYYGMVLSNNYVIPKTLLENTHKKIDYLKNNIKFNSHKEFILNFIKEAKSIFGDIYIRLNGFLDFPAVHITLEKPWLPRDCNYHDIAPISGIDMFQVYLDNSNDPLMTENYIQTILSLNTDLQKVKRRNSDKEIFTYHNLLQLSKEYTMDISILNKIFNKDN